MTKKLQVGIFADKGMGKWLVQSFEPLNQLVDFTLFISENNKHDYSNFQLPKHILTHKHETSLTIKNIKRYIKRWWYDNEKLTHVDFYPFSLEEYFSKNPLDIAVTKSDRSLYTLASLKNKFNYKLIYRYGPLPFIHILDKRSELAYRKSFDMVDHFYCFSNTARQNLENEGIESSKIDVIYNSVNLSFFSPGNKDSELMAKLNITNNDKLILFVGKLTSWKNPFTILYAAKLLFKKKLPIKVLFAGRGAQKQNLQNMACFLGLRDRVIFLDFIENAELNKYYRLADVFVMPSLSTLMWEDHFPFAVIEAMASGLPVIVTNSGGMPELIGDVGRIYPQGNYRELSRHLYEILIDEQLRSSMAVNSRQRAEEMFNNKKNSMKIYSVFQKVINKE